MNNEKGKIYYGLGLDNSQLQADANAARAMLKGIGNSAEVEGARIDNAYRKIAASVATVFGVDQAIQFAKSVVDVRGEIESLEISFETLVGKDMAKTLFSQIRTFATDTPLLLNDLSRGAQMLLSFDVPAEQVMTILKQIGDVSMGDPQKFNSLTLAFSQMSSTGKLMGQDLLQMINAGFNPLTVMAEKTGKTVAQLRKDMEGGSISAEMVAKAFADATGEGGKFNGMLEKQSKGIQGLKSNFQGAWDDMLNDLGTKNQDFISSSIEGATDIVQNYDKVGESLAVLIATYGAYKAAIIATDVIEKSAATIRYTAQAEELSKLLTVEQQAKISKMGLAKTSAEYAGAVSMEVSAEMERQTKLAVATNAEIAAARVRLEAARNEKASIAEKVAAREAELASAVASGNAKKIEAAQTNLNTTQEQLNTASVTVNSAAREVSSKRAVLDTAIRKANTIETGINTAAQTANVTATNLLSAAKLKLTAIATKLNAAIMKNPYAIAAAAVIALGYGIYKLATYQTDAEKTSQKLNDAIKDGEKATQAERYQIDLMFQRLRDAKKGTEEYEAAKQAIISQYGQYLSKLGDEKTALNDIAAAYKLITEEATKASNARAMAQIQSDAGDAVAEKSSDVYDDVAKMLKKKFGIDKGAEHLKALKPAIMEGAAITAEMQNIIQQFDKHHDAKYDAESGIKIMDEYTSNAITDKLNSLASVKAAAQQKVKQATDKFGPSAQPEDTTAFDATKASLQQLMAELPKVTDKLAELKKAAAPDPEAIAKQERGLALINAQIAARESELAVIRDVKAQIKNLQDEQEKYSKDDPEYKSLETRIKALKTKLPKTEQQENKVESDAARIKRETAERNKKIEEYGQEVQRQIKQSELDIAQATIDAKEDGYAKEQAQNNLIYDRMIFANQQREAEMVKALQDARELEWENANPKAKEKGETFDRSTVTAADLLPEQKAQLVAYETVANEIKLSANKKLLKDLLDNYQDYEAQRATINKQTEDDIAALEKSRTPENSAQIDASIAQARKQQKNALSQVNLSELKEDINWESVFGNLDKVSYDTLSKLRNNLKEYMQTAQDSLSPTDLKTLADAYDELNEKISTLRPGQAIKNAFADYKTASAELKKAREELEDTKGTDKEAEAQKRVTDALNKRRAAQIAANEAIQGFAGKASEALEAATAMTGALESFGVKIPESIKGALEGVGQIVDGLGSIDLTKPFSIVTGVFKMIGGIGKAIMSLFSGDNRKEKQIQRLQSQVDALAKAYDRLNDAIDKSYSTDSADLIRQQDENLRRQKAAIEEQIRLEEDKKDSDNGKIDQWRKAIDDIDKELAQTNDRIVEAIIGKDVKSAIDEFASAYVDAWAAGEDKAASVKDVVRKMVKSAVTELVKSRLSPEVNQFMSFLANAMQDGILSDAEQSALDEWEQRLYNKANGISDSFDKYLKEDKDREGASRGIATASQESVDENNGRLTAIQGHTYTLNENVKILVANSGKALEHLKGIRENTGNLAKLEEMRKDISTMKTAINDITIKGITIKK